MMKSVIATLALPMAFAGVAQMDSMLSELNNSTAASDGQRNIINVNNPIHTTLSKIWNYGCWCYFQENHGKGSGEAQNYMDEHCRVLHHGYTCVMMDAADENDNACDPFTHEYNTITILGAVPEQVQIDCETRNAGDNCAIRSCAVESYFVLNIFNEAFGDNTFDATLKHDNGFDASVCRGTGGTGSGGSSPWSCCASYPTRFPFRTGNGRRECCAEVTYDTTMFSCCDESTVSISC
jgi:hypothetical protein